MPTFRTTGAFLLYCNQLPFNPWGLFYPPRFARVAQPIFHCVDAKLSDMVGGASVVLPRDTTAKAEPQLRFFPRWCYAVWHLSITFQCSRDKTGNFFSPVFLTTILNLLLWSLAKKTTAKFS